MSDEELLSITVVCPDSHELPFKIKQDVQMVRLMNVFARREGFENIDHLSFYYKDRRIRPNDTPLSLQLANGETITTQISEPDYGMGDSDIDCVYLSD